MIPGISCRYLHKGKLGISFEGVEEGTYPFGARNGSRNCEMSGVWIVTEFMLC